MQSDQEREVDKLLNAVLSHYGAAEPRSGLESRILANLTQVEAASRRYWILSPAVALCAAVLIIAAILFMVRVSQVGHSPRQRQISGTLSHQPELGPNSTKVSVEPERAAHAQNEREQRWPGRRHPSVVQHSGQFPSPAPLSEQERILAGYVQQFPQQAVLMARAQTKLYQVEADEFHRDADHVGNNDNQDQNP